MSSNYTVYTKGNSDVVLQLLKDFLDIELSPSPHDEAVLWGEWVLVPVTFTAQNNMIDDMDIAFSEFPVSIDFSRSASQGDADLRASLCEVTARLFGRHLYRVTGQPNIVVRDEQAIVEQNPGV